MPRIHPFHDSMRLSAAGIGVVRPLVGPGNVNRWFSRDTFADHASGSDEAMVPSAYVPFPSRDASYVCPHWL